MFLTSSADATDVWLSSTLTLHETSLTWSSKCAASLFNISASLCWRLQDHLCTSTLASPRLKVEEGEQLLVRFSMVSVIDGRFYSSNSPCVCPPQRYNTSLLDKHPLMCVQVRRGQMCVDFNKHLSSLGIHLRLVFKFSLQDSHHVYCPFPAGEFKRKEFMCYVFLFLLEWVLLYNIPPRFLQICRRGRCTWVRAGRGCFCISRLQFQQRFRRSCAFRRMEHVCPWETSTLSRWLV